MSSIISSTVPLSPGVAVHAALTYDGFEDEAKGHGQFVRTMLLRVGRSGGEPWALAFLSSVGYVVHRHCGIGRSSWPLPMTGNLEDLADFAFDRRIAYAEPVFGDIALTWGRRANRYVQAGFVTHAERIPVADRERNWRTEVTTIEGNVTPRGLPGGHGIHQVERTVWRQSHMLFVRWEELDGRRALTDPTVLVTRVMGRIEIRRCA